MTKIVEAANAMIANPDKITKVILSDNEIFFSYKEKHKWSIMQNDDECLLYYYPGNIPLETLASTTNWNGQPMIKYSSEEIGTTEARQTFHELFALVKGKLYGMDKALDDIIEDLY